MDVPQLFNAFTLAPNIEVVVTLLPEGTQMGEVPQLAGGVLLEHLEGYAQRFPFWFADQQVDVLGHDDVASDAEVVPKADLFQGVLEGCAGFWC